MFKRALLLFLLVFNVSLVAPTILSPAPVYAQACAGNDSGFLGLPTWYKYLDFEQDTCDISFNVETDVGKVLLAVFEIILRLSGIIAVAFILVGAFQYMLSQGEPDKLKGARTTIINALIGMVIVIFATAIVNLIGNTLT